MSLYWMEDDKQAIDLPKSRKEYYFSVCRLLKGISSSEDMLFNYVANVVNKQCEIDNKG